MPPVLSSAMTMKRIHREIADLKKEDLGPMSLSPVEDNLYTWSGTIPGPQGSVYEGGVFEVEVNLPSDYPFTAPKAIFKTRIYHMNISDHGNVCIDILKHNWSPALSIFKIMLSLSSLLTDPNPKDPLVPSIATQYMRNRRQHDITARQWTELYARPKPPPPSSSVAHISLSPRAKGKSRAQPGGNVAAGRIGVPGASRSSSETGSRSGSMGLGQASSSNQFPGETKVLRVIDPEPIIIDDSDDEGRESRSRTVANGKRKRELAASSSYTTVGGDGNTIEIHDGNDASGSGSTGAKRRAVGENRATQGASRLRRQSSEVIVIDD